MYHMYSTPIHVISKSENFSSKLVSIITLSNVRTYMYTILWGQNKIKYFTYLATLPQNIGSVKGNKQFFNFGLTKIYLLTKYNLSTMHSYREMYLTAKLKTLTNTFRRTRVNLYAPFICVIGNKKYFDHYL